MKTGCEIVGLEACPEPRMLTGNIHVAQACGPIAPRAAVYDRVIIVGEEYEAEPRLELYNSLGVEAILYPLSSGKTPTILSIVRLIHENMPSEHEKLLIEGFGAEGVVAAAFLMVAERTSPREAASRLLAMGHGLTTPLDSRLLYLLHRVLETSPDWFQTVASTVMQGYREGFLHGDGHASSVAELAVELNEELARLGYFTGYTPYMLFRDAVLHTDEPSNVVHEVAAALDSTLTGAVKTVVLRRDGGTLYVIVGCELLLHQEQCWPEVEAAWDKMERLARKAGFEKIRYVMTGPEEAACLSYSSIDRGLCEA